MRQLTEKEREDQALQNVGSYTTDFSALAGAL